jgi:hypothetical protein
MLLCLQLSYAGNYNYISNAISLDFYSILSRNSIDLDSKSNKGWIRIFNSKSKLKDYKIKVTETERVFVIAKIKKIQKKESQEKGRTIQW